jgi:putative hydrolase of the HAD superfamily
MINLKNIRNIIFDLGGVILDIHIDKTVQGLRKAGMKETRVDQAFLVAYPFFMQYEKGEISTEVFRSELRRITGDHMTDDALESIWNAMVGGFDPLKVDLLKKLRTRYRTFLLSNTNAMHEVCYNKILRESTGVENLNALFEHVYYSHRVHMRKPDPEIFEYVLNDAGLVPSETLFIDDLEMNIDSAARLGIMTCHLTGEDSILSIFG